LATLHHTSPEKAQSEREKKKGGLSKKTSTWDKSARSATRKGEADSHYPFRRHGNHLPGKQRSTTTKKFFMEKKESCGGVKGGKKKKANWQGKIERFSLKTTGLELIAGPSCRSRLSTVYPCREKVDKRRASLDGKKPQGQSA